MTMICGFGLHQEIVIWWVVFTGVLCTVLLQQAIITPLVCSVNVTHGLRQSHRVFCVAGMLENCVTPTWWLKHCLTHSVLLLCGGCDIMQVFM